MYVLCVYACGVCDICMCCVYMYVVCDICICCVYVCGVCDTCMCCVYMRVVCVIYVCAVYMHVLCVIYVCAVCICMWCALILEAGTAQVALLSGLRGPQVLGREARLHTPAWLPSLPAPLLCNWGLPAPTYFFTHTVLSACSSPTPRPAWELPFPRDPLRPSASLAFSPP